jgi:hypothetical protein
MPGQVNRMIRKDVLEARADPAPCVFAGSKPMNEESRRSGTPADGGQLQSVDARRRRPLTFCACRAVRDRQDACRGRRRQ